MFHHAKLNDLLASALALGRDVGKRSTDVDGIGLLSTREAD